MALLPPLLLFVFFYLEYQAELPVASEFSIGVVVVASLYLFILFYALYHARVRVLRLRSEPSLRVMLERYAEILRLRFFSIAGASLLLLGGFIVMHDQLFVALFLVALIVFSVFWPTPSRVANDLKLKGDARQMVLTKKDDLLNSR